MPPPAPDVDAADPGDPWYETWFDSDVYPLVYQHRDDEDARSLIDLVEQTAAPDANASILDVGCGRGRHAILLARRGYDVTGLDLSEASIRAARVKAEDAGVDATFTVGDMREPVCEACADGVVNLFTTFGFFSDVDDDRAALHAMATALRPGGWIVQDFLNAPHVRASLVPESQRTENGIRIHEKRWIDDGCVYKNIRLDDGERTHEFTERVRLHTLDDFRTLYDDAGLDLLDTFGDYDGSPHSESSPRLILFGRKR